MHPDFLSNAFLVADEPGGHGVIIDSGGPSEPLLAAVEQHKLTVEHLLVTHHHWDHVMGSADFKDKLGVEILGHPFEARELEKYDELLNIDRTIEGGDTIPIGGLQIEALHTPGHTAGMLAFMIKDQAVFTGDTLFKGSVGGARVLGSTNFADLKRSIMDVLMELPAELVVYPGHTEPTKVAAEWEANPFIRTWRGLDPEGTEKCTVGEKPATLLVWAPDYDGGYKALVRWDDTGQDDVVPGSQVLRGEAVVS